MSNSNKWKKYIGLAGILFLFPLVWLLFFGVGGKHNFKTCPYFEPGSLSPLEYSDYNLPPFVFKDQNGHAFALDSLQGKVWVAAFYSLNDPFVSNITQRLLDINFRYRNEPDIVIVSFSTDCAHDTPVITKPYIEQNVRYNQFPGKWIYLTGDQGAMQSYLRNGFGIVDLKNEPIFRLIGPDAKIRGLYGNTEYHLKDAKEDIALLKKEMDLKKYNEKKASEGVQ